MLLHLGLGKRRLPLHGQFSICCINSGNRYDTSLGLQPEELFIAHCSLLIDRIQAVGWVEERYPTPSMRGCWGGVAKYLSPGIRDRAISDKMPM